MDVNDLKGLYAEVNKRMGVAVEHVKHELAGVRKPRVGHDLDSVHVEAYVEDASQSARRVSIPADAIAAQPFVRRSSAIEGHHASDLGLTPAATAGGANSDSSLTERPQELSRHVHKQAKRPTRSGWCGATRTSASRSC
jgi:ribosome recycling factor